ncbi:Serine/threonine protein kinase [Trichostrongylus colubriformis]|uniref:Serine/threonine protein kinase n=1 Tax=Trichostrongylus colubriformis TaxID=6319 RepID=A0AAN8F9T6_TRICO
MKVEKKLETRRHSKLKMEIAILKLVSAERKQSHFTEIIDRGKKETFFFLVMELVGKSLADLKSQQPAKVFSVPTAMGAGIQCLEACEDLHKHGFIHRDLKPANYACGLGDKRRVIYILDFGIARKILNEKGELKTPRQSVRFKGTIRFASISCHKSTEMGPKDDCESWFYLILDITIPKGLVWKSVSNKEEVLKLKEEMRTTKREAAFFGIKCKDELGKVLDYIDSLKYHDHVDYEFIYKCLAQAANTAGGDIKDPYDWEKIEEKATAGSSTVKSSTPTPSHRPG